MTISSVSQAGWLKKSGLFLMFFVLEAMIFAILPLSARLPINALLYVHAGLTAILLVAALLLRRGERGKEYWQVFCVLFVAGVAVLLSTLFSSSLLKLFRLTSASPSWIAVAKLSESLWRVAPILVLMAIIGADRRSMYLNKGKLCLGLAVGIAGFVVFAGLAFIPLANQGGMLNKLLSLSPWILIFVLANGFMEELLYRGEDAEQNHGKTLSCDRIGHNLLHRPHRVNHRATTWSGAPAVRATYSGRPPIQTAADCPRAPGARDRRA